MPQKTEDERRRRRAGARVTEDALRRPAVRVVFPRYTATEIAADRAVHLVGLAAAVVATTWLVASTGSTATVRQLATLLIYSVGLIGMLATSATYNLFPPGHVKALLRRLDHSMIFVMIAGSYTPFALNALDPHLGVPLCAAVWALAFVGAVLKLISFDRVQRVSLLLYLGMGWLLLAVVRSLIAALPTDVLVLLLSGGVAYSFGSLVHTRRRMPLHNAISGPPARSRRASRMRGSWAPN